MMKMARFGTVIDLLGRATRTLVADPRDAALSARMSLWVILVSLLARLLPLPRVQQLISTRLRPVSAADRPPTPEQLARTIDRLLRLDLFVFRRSCWKRALVLHRFLAFQGIESRIMFGVQKQATGPIQGHAWLEHQGRPLLEPDADPGAYIVTFSLPRTPSAWGSSRK